MDGWNLISIVLSQLICYKNHSRHRLGVLILNIWRPCWHTHTHTHSYNLFTVQWVLERISGVRLHISAERHYFFPQFLLAEIWVFDLFKMQSDSSTPESEREAHDCATKFEGLNAVTHREGELFCTCWILTWLWGYNNTSKGYVNL